MADDLRIEDSGVRESSGLALEAAIFAVVALFSLLWFYVRMAPGIAFGPWQGLLLHDSPLFPVPLVSSWVARWAMAADGMDALWRLNFESAFFGALSCGATAAFASSALKRRFHWGAAAAGGLVAGCVLAAMPPMVYAATAGGTTTLTVFLIAAGLTCLVAALDMLHRSILLLWAGLFAGLAAANHPASGVVGVFMLFGTILAGPEDLPLRLVLERASFVLVAFLLGATAPLFHVLSAGSSLPEFLAHALPESSTGPLAFWPPVLDVLPWGVFILTLPGLALVSVRGIRAPAAMALGTFFCLGPFLPLVQRQVGGASAHDEATPLLIAFAMAAAFLGWGAGAVVAAVSRKGWRRWLAPVAGPLLAAALLLPQWPALPDRRHDAAEQLGREILDSCPAGGFLITGNALIESLALACQTADEYRTDVHLLPAAALTDPANRMRVALLFEGVLDLPERFPTPGALDRWSMELPFHVAAVADALDLANHPRQLEDFALWDLATANPQCRPFAFAGLSTPWLTARACPQGPLLLYPPVEKEPAGTLGDPPPNDPDAAMTWATLLAPLSDNARMHSRHEESRRLAEEAATLAPFVPDALLGLVHAEARMGRQEEALQVVERFLTRFRRFPQAGRVEATLTQGLDACAAEYAFRGYLLDSPLQDLTARHLVFDRLWETDELVLLKEGYETILRTFPKDADALYQLAAVHAQLGYWEQAERGLMRWREAGSYPLESVRRQLTNDGRFAPFLLYRKDFLLPGPDDNPEHQS